jgi:hypothetical protein
LIKYVLLLQFFLSFSIGRSVLPVLLNSLSIATYLQPSVAVRPNPVRFQLPENCANEEIAAKENKAAKGLPYRSVFAVLTWDTVLIYDTIHSSPLAVVQGLHYCHLVDAVWSSDGRHLIVCSIDGYVSFLSFTEGELGKVYTPPLSQDYSPSSVDTTSTASTTATSNMPKLKIQQPTLCLAPPCEAGPTILEGRPSKKAKTKIAPTLVSGLMMMDATTSTNNKRPAAADETDDVGNAVDMLSLEEQRKKKKRVTPTLVDMQ